MCLNKLRGYDHEIEVQQAIGITLGTGFKPIFSYRLRNRE